MSCPFDRNLTTALDKHPVVCCANYCKCLCIIYTAIRYSKHSDSPLSILGDALASFLREPDIYTHGMSIVSYKDIQADCNAAWKRPVPRRWRPLRRRWASAASRQRWCSVRTLKSSFSLLNQKLSHETCLERFYSLDKFQGSLFLPRQARLTPDSQSRA